MDITDMFNDIPLVSAFQFQKDAWDQHPQDIVAELLHRVHEMEKIK
jgi:hypothetical protein